MKVIRTLIIFTLLAGIALVSIFFSEKINEVPVASQAIEPIGNRVFPISEAGKEVDLDFLLNLSIEELKSRVPKQSGIRFTDCPACKGGAQDTGKFCWEPQNPQQITCISCKEVYPGNKKFPDNHVHKVASRGDLHLYPYFEREDGYKIYFQAHADHLSRGYMTKAARDFARKWWQTKDERYAQKAAAILVKFAEVYPGYAVHYDYPFTPKVIVPPDHGIIKETISRPKLTSKWDYWMYLGISQELAEAYDILRYWPPLQEMANKRALEMIERDLLGGMLSLVLGYDEKYKSDETYTNMSPVMWRDAIRAARLTRHPEALLDVLTRINNFLDNRFLYDGSWYEASPSYGQQVYGSLLGIKSALSGAKESFASGQINDQQAADIAKIETRLGVLMERLHASLNQTRFPNGGLLPINDTWAVNRAAPARAEMKAGLFPGMGVSIMGGGSGDHQFHSYLNFSGGDGHAHKAALSIGLWVHGSELLSDLGYTHTSHRFWVTSTASHNTVLVDGKDQKNDSTYSGNRLTLWASNHHDFHISEAESVSAYPGLERYQRTLVAIGKDAKDSYLVDLFQITGGFQHDYLLASNADQKYTAQLNLSLEPYGKTIANQQRPFQAPKGENDQLTPAAGLTFIRNLRRSSLSQTACVDFLSAQGVPTGVRSWIDCGGDASFFLGEAPSIRQAAEIEGQVKDYNMPMLIARRNGQNLKSVFVAVHAPSAGIAPSIESVDVNRIDGGVVVTIHRGTVKDRVFIATENQAQINLQTTEGNIGFNGKAGWLRWEAGRLTTGELVNGVELTSGNSRILGDKPLRGKIQKVFHSETNAGTEDGFLIAEVIPAGQKLDVLIVEFADGTSHGYNVQKVEVVEGGSRIYTKESPSITFSETETRLTAFPQRTILGQSPSYRGITRTSYQPQGK